MKNSTWKSLSITRYADPKYDCRVSNLIRILFKIHIDLTITILAEK